MYWLKKGEAKRRLKSEKQKRRHEVNCNQRHRRKISAGNATWRNLSSSSSSTKLNVPDSKLIAKDDEVATDSAPEEARLVEGHELDEHLQTDKNNSRYGHSIAGCQVAAQLPRRYALPC